LGTLLHETRALLLIIWLLNLIFRNFGFVGIELLFILAIKVAVFSNLVDKSLVKELTAANHNKLLVPMFKIPHCSGL